MLNTVHGSRTIAPEENFPTALTETLTLAQTLVITGGEAEEAALNMYSCG